MATAAELLLGRTLEDGWKVIERIETPPVATGGCFSVCYLVESARGNRAFLKALDYSRAFGEENPDPARALQAMTEAYNFERDLLKKCSERKMDHVVRALGDGSLRVSEAQGVNVVQYLLFELADHDVRLHLALSEKIDVAWKLRSLHHVATGLRQLHSAGIAHQDLKPSNVLVFEDQTSKVGDLGRAAYEGKIGPWDGLAWPGDPAYAPPELLYGHRPPDWRTRRLGSDLYLMGSMIFFFFTGLSATHLLTSELPPELRPGTWRGTFDEGLPYFRDAFGRAVSVLRREIPGDFLKTELGMIVSQLCDPDPRHRGVPRGIRGLGSQFSLERYVTKFDLLASRCELRISRGR